MLARRALRPRTTAFSAAVGCRSEASRILGLEVATFTAVQLRDAYYKAARAFHPDTFDGCPTEAGKLFIRATEAYELLGDVARFRQSEAREAVPEPRPASTAAAPPASGTAGAAADARTPAKRAAKPAKTPTRSLSKRLSSISPMRRRRPSEAPHEDALLSLIHI